MGGGASSPPAKLDEPTAKKLAGARWDRNKFLGMAVNGTITKAQFEECQKKAFPTIQQLRQQSEFAKARGTLQDNLDDRVQKALSPRKDAVNGKERSPRAKVKEYKSQLDKLQTFSSAGIRGAFQRIKTLGKGSFGKVFLVRRISNHQLYAMKVIRLDGSTLSGNGPNGHINAQANPQLAQQLAEQALKEVQFLQMLQHPNVSHNVPTIL